MKKSSWLDHRRPEHVENAPKWIYVEDVYSGDYVSDDRLETYLPIREKGETDEAYEYRRRMADPDLLFATLINSLAGQVFSVESEVARVFQPEEATEGLGDPEDSESIAGRLWRDADGDGGNYPVFWRRATVDILKFQRLWFLAEGVEREATDADGDAGDVVRYPHLKRINPERVMDWQGDAARLTEVKVKSKRLKPRESLRDEPEEESVWTVYGVDGWQRYRKKTETDAADGAKTVEELIDEGAYEWYSTVADRAAGRRCAPLFYVDLPLGQNIAYLLARKAMAAFNMESGRDALLNTGNTPRLVDESADELSLQHAEEIEDGGNFHQTVPGEKLYYISPPTDAAQLATDVLDAKRRNLFVSGYKQYADAAAQKTATEVRQDRIEGVEAALAFLSVAVDEAENRGLFFIAQANFPTSPDVWNDASVERSLDFAPVNAVAEAEKLTASVFGPGQRIPVGPTGRRSAVEKFAAANAIEIVDAEVEAELNGVVLTDQLFNTLAGGPTTEADDAELAERLAEADAVPRSGAPNGAPGTDGGGVVPSDSDLVT